ncbi:MAG TPA: citrate/2-methylcitrate synthase [Desulfosalsimonadaceae bacterium]|nr:citrate/2-methylcitrate synthase [Desulfosalsimonadaceae bacterium]
MADTTKDIKNTGLRGVTVASTKICHVDGDAGKLIYRGYLITDLAEKATYEEVVHLLLYEKLPNPEELKQFRKELAQNRAISDDVIAALKTRPKTSLPMDILQAAVPMLANHDPNPEELKIENAGRIATRLIAQFETIVAAWHRIRQDKEPVAPDPDLNHAGNFLYMMSGEKPDEDMTHFMDTCLVLHAEHSFNASTFSARQVCSTHAHMYAAVAAAVGSLSGELHGGANARVMQMLKEIGSIDAIDDYVRKKLDSGGKIMGLGHAVYKNGDPRAAILAPMSKRMGEKVNDTRWYELSDALEKKGKEVFKEKKGADIFANVDFYSASLYYAMGIPIDLFTPVFAISRIAGWAAHVIEEQFAGAAPKPVLYRPASEYIGEYCGPEECAFVPMEERN